jgi:DNA-binding transcriptional regulator YiaG
VTVAVDAHDDAAPTVRFSAAADSPLSAYDNKPVEFWPTAAIRLAVESGDLTIWQRIVLALKRDPYGRTARQIEEVVETTSSLGITNALTEVLVRSRAQLDADERTEVALQVKALINHSGLGPREFASRIGVSGEELATYLEGDVSPSAAQMVRMRKLADRFAQMKAQRPARPE